MIHFKYPFSRILSLPANRFTDTSTYSIITRSTSNSPLRWLVAPLIYRCLSTSNNSTSNSNLNDKKFPPTHFQDQSNPPLPFNKITNSNTPPVQVPPPTYQQIRPANGEAFTIGELLANSQTRPAILKIVILFLLLDSFFVYQYLETAQESSRLQDEVLEVWESYEQKDISQTVMAVHIGMLKKQLLDVGLVPVPSSKAIEMSKQLLSFRRRDDDGQLLIYVDPKSPIYDLIPFHLEYNVTNIKKFRDV